ncbi:hypothetical protein Klosneuvirus_2_40 [Klosneuvirus KNV1]|uniref:Uncharacterized protein n=1 Tax=Klosneuvirus KNV1 TaxID=1977640 RepID=A0A1V0SIY5_9VIRU|nr:hypothetical protein Klosneuvirus_2_40 [Klosneuvirus KNV1]
MSYARTILAVGTAQNTVPVRNEVYLVDGSTGPTGNTGTIMTLPNIVSDGMSFTFRRYDTGASGTVVTIKGFTGTQTINNVDSLTLPGLSDIVLHSYEYKWYTVQGINKSSLGLPLNFRFTQPNGSGAQTSSNSWFRIGTFIYRGSSVDGDIGSANILLYTTNASTYYRARLWDRTNTTQLSITTPFNTGTNTSPRAVTFGTITSTPATPAILEIQLLATDSTGNTGVSGRQNIGIHSLQLYG